MGKLNTNAEGAKLARTQTLFTVPLALSTRAMPGGTWFLLTAFLVCQVQGAAETKVLLDKVYGAYVITKSGIGMDTSGVVSVVLDPAKAAGIQVGDTVTGLDGKPGLARATIAAYIRNRQPGDSVDVRVKRAGGSKHTTFALAEGKTYKLFDSLSTILGRGQEVRLAISVSVANLTVGDSVLERKWSAMMEENWLSLLESSLEKALGWERGFQLVDRTSIDQVLREVATSQTGVATSEIPSGRIRTATHLLRFTVSRFPEGLDDCRESYKVRIVEVESGRVIVSWVTTHRCLFDR